MNRSHPLGPTGVPPRRLALLFETSALALALVVILLFFAAGQARAALEPRTQAGRAQTLAGGLEWQVLAPTGWVSRAVNCTVLVTWAAGLDPSAVRCDYSEDGGSSWKPTPATASYAGPLTSTVLVSAADIPLTTSSADRNRVRFFIRDAEGNEQLVPNDGSDGFIIRFDKDPPARPTGLVASPSAWTNVDGVFALTWTNPPDVSGIVRARYTLGKPPAFNNPGIAVAGSDIHTLSNLHVDNPGSHSIYVWLEDAAGNTYEGNWALLENAFRYDPTPPESSVQFTGTEGNNGWYRSGTVTVTLSATDSGSGVISALHHKLDVSPWVTKTFTAAPYNWIFPVTGDGTHTLRYRATDGAGNLEAEHTRPLNIDSIPPTTVIGWTGTEGSGGWYRSPVTVILTPTDALSGWASTWYTTTTGGQMQNGKQATLSDGRWQFRFHSVDKAGNVETTRGPQPFDIDTQAPLITATLPVSAAGWYSGPVNISLAGSDPGGAMGSGLAAIEYYVDTLPWTSRSSSPVAVTLNGADGPHTLHYRARDAAGNQTPERTQTVNLDTKAPSISGLSLDGTAGTNGWYVSSVTGALNASDPAPSSGNMRILYQVDGVGEFVPGASFTVLDDGVHTVRARAVDGVGNVGATRTFTDAIKIDRAAPEITWGASREPNAVTGWYTASVAITLTARDVAPSGVISSGVQTVEYKLDSGAWTPVAGAQAVVPIGEGEHTLLYRARDAAGNLKEAGPLTIKVDTRKPSTGDLTLSGTEGANGWYVSPEVSVTVPATDTVPGSGVSQVYYQLDEAPFTLGPAFPVYAEGVHTIRAYAVDGAGNVGSTRIYTGAVKIDRTAPEVSWVASPEPNIETGWYTASVAITLTAQDKVAASGVISSGVQEVAYRIDGGNWITVTGAVAVPSLSDGVRTLSYRARDMAGNLSGVVTLPLFNVDTKAPAATASFDGTLGDNGWYTSTGTVTLAGTDPIPGSGLKQLHYQLDGGILLTGTAPVTVPIATEGEHLVMVQPEDGAGNRGPVSTLSLKIDATPPTLSETRSAPPNEYGWYNQSVYVTLSASDVVTGVATSGVDKVEYREGTGPWKTVTGPILFSVYGKHDCEARARDKAGNISATWPFTVYIDNQAPRYPEGLTITPTVWTNVNSFDASWTNPDDLSGIAAAYYTIGSLPGQGTPTLVPVTVTGNLGQASGLRAPTSGQFIAYLWLVDKAGNSDWHYAGSDLAHYIRFDNQPPTNARATISSGTLGCNGYYVTPVRVRLQADDTPSGVAAFTYITATTWVTVPVNEVTKDVLVDLAVDDTYTVRFKAIDKAGNVQATESKVDVPIDQMPPPAPVDLQVGAVGWSKDPTFTVSWSEPLPSSDRTLITGGLYTLNKAPTKAADGTYTPIVRSIGGRFETLVTVPAEGTYTLYYWLRDGACNSDYTTYVTRTLKYDATPPTVTLTPERQPDRAPWYTRAVNLTFTASDGVSGVDVITYTVNGGAVQTVQTGARLTLDQSGVYTIVYGGRDKAGNTRAPQTVTVKVDMTPPTTWVSAPATAEPGFTVTWGASDSPSNLVSRYWVQYRDNGGAWTNWQTETAATSAVFPNAQRGHRYDFQVRARDEAGNEGVFPGLAQATTLVNPLPDDGLDGWTVNSTPQVPDPNVPEFDPSTTWKVSEVPGVCGAEKAILLGSPDYGPGLDGAGTVPSGTVSISREVVVPPVRPGERVLLSFRYRMHSYDCMSNRSGTILFDTFEADILNTQDALLSNLVMDGVPFGEWQAGVERVLGCKAPGPFDLTQWSGQTIKLRFSNSSRGGHNFNTWTYLEDVQIKVVRRINLPLVLGAGTRAAGQAQVAPTPLPRPTVPPASLTVPTAAPPAKGNGPAPTPDPRDG